MAKACLGRYTEAGALALSCFRLGRRPLGIKHWPHDDFSDRIILPFNAEIDDNDSGSANVLPEFGIENSQLPIFADYNLQDFPEEADFDPGPSFDDP